MATTNSTKKTLNKYQVEDSSDALYGIEVRVNTGNIKDKDYKIVKNKYTTGKVLNNTYTLEPTTGNYEETGVLLNYDDCIKRDDSYIYGHPDKFIYDTNQMANNCGIASALNILSIAGKVNIVAPTKEQKAALGEPYTVKVKDKYGRIVEKTVTPKIDYSQSSEEKLTLWAIKNDFCNHSKDISAYKTINDIEEEDGGTYLVDVNPEFHKYHDPIESINSILGAYGVDSSTTYYKIRVQNSSNFEVETIDDKGDEIPLPENAPEGTKPQYKDKYTTYKIKKTLSYSISSQLGNDTLIIEDYTKEDLLSRDFLFVRSGRDLYFNFDEANYVKIINYYEATNPTEDDWTSKIRNVRVRTNNGEYENIALSDLISMSKKVYSSEAQEANLRKYGTFIKELAKYVKEGRGIVLEGYAKTLNGGTGGNHAMVLTGVSYHYLDELKTIYDIEGFYVADSGGWLTSSAGEEASVVEESDTSSEETNASLGDDSEEESTTEAGSAQFISCEQLYNFLTNSTYNTSQDMASDNIYYNRTGVKALNSNSDINEKYDPRIVLTDDCIKSWADELNLVGNARRNTLRGNEANNILKGGDQTDFLFGRGGDDELYGGNGDDWLHGEAGNNTLNGGSGNDTYVFSTLNNAPVYKLDKKGNIEYETIRYTDPTTKEVQYITKPIVIGYEKKDDIIIPGSGKDTLRFENINKDTLSYFNDNGNLVIKYNYHCINEEKNKYDYDTITVKDYFKKNLYNSIGYLDDATTIENRENNKTEPPHKFLDLLKENTIVNIIDKTSKATISGSQLDDEIDATKYNDTITAGAGDDVIDAGAGDDVIKAGAGWDTIVGGYGNDKIYLESGKNEIVYTDDISGYDTIYSGKGEDTIKLTNISQNDVKFAQKGNNLVIIYDEKGSSITIADYYKKKGQTSIKEIQFSDGSIYPTQLISGTYTGNDVDDTIKSSGLIVGGLGCDTMGGVNGANTFKISTMYDGADTILAQKAGSVTVDFSSLAGLTIEEDKNFVGGYERFSNGEGNYAFSKQGNNLVINYGLEVANDSMSRVVLQNYFKLNKKVSYTLRLNDSTYDLLDARVYIEGNLNAKNNITGSAQDDIIFGGKLADTIKAGAGNDDIYGGKGNDVIYGGAGINTVYYNYGDGSDTINLSKNEDLRLYLKSSEDGIFDKDKLTYTFDKNKNLIISHDGLKILTIKGFGKKDATGASGALYLFVEDALVEDLKFDTLFAKYTSFSKKKYSYTGKWYSDYIDASGLASAVNKKSKGVTINAAAGDDIVIGSDFNDTIKGGVGDDLLIGKGGANALDGGNGNDTYYLFYKGELKDSYLWKEDGEYWSVEENTTVKDTGATGKDRVFLYANKDNLKVYFNISDSGTIIYDKDKKGRDIQGSFAINIETTDTTKNKASLTFVEQIISRDNYAYKINDEILNEVSSWLRTNHFANIKEAILKGTKGQIETLYSLFLKKANGDAYTEGGWVEINPDDLLIQYSDFDKDKYFYSGKWYSEYIDARGLEEATNKYNRGISVNSDAGDDKIYGSKYNDSIDAGTGDDRVWAGEGDDIIYGGTGDDEINGEKGNDIIFGEDGDDKIWGEDGDDSIYGGEGDDSIYGGKGNDFIFGGDGVDTIYGEDGNDEIYGGLEADTIHGGAGDDIITVGSATYENGVITSGDIELDKEINIAYGEDGNDIIYGAGGADKLYGGNGNNTIYGNDGNDTIVSGLSDNYQQDYEDGDTKYKNTVYGGAGNDTIYGYRGDDIIYGGVGTDTIYGGAGNDYIVAGSGEYKTEEDFGENEDYVLGELKNNSTEDDDSDNIIYGGSGNDKIFGAGGADTIDGGDGDDEIYGGAGADKLYGGNGNNVLKGGSGDDIYIFRDETGANNTVISQYGDERLIFETQSKSDLEFHKATEDLIIKYNTNSQITVDGYFKEKNPNNHISYLDDSTTFNNTDKSAFIFDNVLNESKIIIDIPDGINDIKGSSFNEIITVDTGNNSDFTISSSGGNDEITTRGGNDKIDAGEGNDIINAGDGNNIINGGSGDDNITSGSGADIIYGGEGTDVINSGAGNDKIIAGNSIAATEENPKATRNKVYGGEGSDEYYLFYTANIDEEGNIEESATMTEHEKTDIDDKGTSGTDTVHVCANVSNINIYFNTDTNGNLKGALKYNISIGDGLDNDATATGIETITSLDGYSYNYESSELKEAIAAWFLENKMFTDVAGVMDDGGGTDEQKNQLYAAFKKGWSQGI